MTHRANHSALRPFAIGVGALALAATTGVVTAEDFPEEPPSMIVSYSAGGATDFQARIVTMKAEEMLGQPVTIINRPGAGGMVGWNALARQGEDEGYDLAAYNVPHFIAQSITQDTAYNIDNLEPIANWGADPAVLIVPKDSPFDSAEELVEHAEENPDSVTVSGAGRYVGHHIATLQLEQAADIDLRYVPTKGGVDALKYVTSGETDAGFNNLSDAYRSRDQLKILAVAAEERYEEFLPDVPTFEEIGIDVDNSSVNYRGVMTVKGVPEERLEQLSEAFVEMFEDDGVRAKMKEGGSPMEVMGREEVREMWEERQDYLDELLGELLEEED